LVEQSLAHSGTESTGRIEQDLKIEVSGEEELLAACEFALEWFEDWNKRADHEHDFGGQHRVMQKLRRAIAEV
jgi:hypothetical protein